MMRTLGVTTAAIAAIAASATFASAGSVPSPVVVASGACPSGYFEIARVGGNVVCGHVPSVRTAPPACTASEFPITVFGVGLCIS